MTEPAGVWLYAVAEGIPGGLRGLSGVRGGAVRAVTAAGLAAVASDVGLEEFGESALRANLEDLAWLEETATAHHRVIDAVSRAHPVVPMRLATVYSDDANVIAMLGQRGDDLREVLDRIGARKEWGVKAYASAAADAAPGAEGAGAGQPGSGAEYLRRRREAVAASKQARNEVLAGARRVHQTLSEFAAASRLHPPQAPVLAGSKATMILNAAYLVDESNDQQFGDIVQQLAGRVSALQLQLTGPWPPYSFAGLAGGPDGDEP